MRQIIMRLAIPHQKSRKEVRTRIESLIHGLAARYSGYIRDVSEAWDGDRLDFEFKAKGAKVRGTLEITDDEVVVNGKIPLIAKPFEGRIRDMIEREGTSLLNG